MKYLTFFFRTKSSKGSVCFTLTHLSVRTGHFSSCQPRHMARGHLGQRGARASPTFSQDSLTLTE